MKTLFIDDSFATNCILRFFLTEYVSCELWWGRGNSETCSRWTLRLWGRIGIFAYGRWLLLGNRKEHYKLSYVAGHVTGDDVAVGKWQRDLVFLKGFDGYAPLVLSIVLQHVIGDAGEMAIVNSSWWRNSTRYRYGWFDCLELLDSLHFSGDNITKPIVDYEGFSVWYVPSIIKLI